MTWPVCSRTNSGVGPLELAHTEVGGDLGGVDAVGARRQNEHRRAVGVEEQAVGDRTDLAAQRLGRECRGVHRVGQDDDLTGAAAARVVVAEPGDRRVFGVHGARP